MKAVANWFWRAGLSAIRRWKRMERNKKERRKEWDLDSDCGGLTAECRAQVCSLTPDTQCAPRTSIETGILFMFHRVAHTCFLANNLQNITWGKWSLKRKTTMKAATHFPLCEGFPCAAGVWMKILEPAGDEEMSSFCLLSTNGRGRQLLLPFLFFGGEGLPPMLHIIRKGAGQHAAPRGQQRDASWSCFYDDDMYRKGSDSSFNQVHVASRSRGAFLMVSCGQTTGRVTTRQEHVTVIITSGVWWRPGCPTLLALSPSTISLRHKLKLKISGNHVVSFLSDEF